MLPDAELKIYLDASLAERARRRYLSAKRAARMWSLSGCSRMCGAGTSTIRTRQHAPLAAAPDAIVVDSTGLSIEQVVERVRVLLKPPARRAVNFIGGVDASGPRGIPLGRYIWGPVLRFLICLMLKIEMTGLEHLPKTGAGIVYYNHIHWLDPVLICGQAAALLPCR